MDDAVSMRCVESGGHLGRNTQCLVERQRATFEPLGQRLALQVLHHQKVGVLLPADVVERADIGMVECRDRFGFALEPLTYVWVGRDMRG